MRSNKLVNTDAQGRFACLSAITLAAALLGGCVTTGGTPIAASETGTMRGRISSRVVLQQPFSIIEFKGPETFQLIFGASGMPIGAVPIRPIDRPASMSLGEAAMTRFRLLSPAAEIAERVARLLARARGLEYDQSSGPDYILEIDGDHYGVTTLPKYTLLADFHFRLRKTSDSRVISSGTCRYLTPEASRTGSGEEWLANDGKLLRSEFRAAPDFCAKRIYEILSGSS